MGDDKTFGFASGGLGEIDSVRIVCRGNDEFLSLGIMVLHLLSRHVENAHHAHVFALDGNGVVGRIGGEAECRDAFAYT